MKKSVLLMVIVVIIVFLIATFYFSGCKTTEEISPIEGDVTEEEATGESVTITVATVNNPDMIVMEELSSQFTKETGININWVVLPENEIRQKVTEDVAMGAGEFDIVTIGILEVKNWVNYEWIVPLEPFFEKMSNEEREAYDLNDVIESVRVGLSANDKLYALPFYGETSIVYYRKDIFEEAGLTMPEEPTWDEIYDLAKKIHDPDENKNGLILRGLPGWGENMAVFGTMINAFGARWYDMEWNAQFDTPEMRDTFEMYYKLIKDVCAPGAVSVGFTEGVTLMAQGNGAIWYDASVAGGLLNDPNQSEVAGKIGYARAPWAKKHDNGWLWAWALAIEASSNNQDEAFEFLTWATSKEYINLVGEEKGWVTVPPGSRESTYVNPNYIENADFAPVVLDAIKAVDYDNPALEEVPYIGTPFVVIPEWPGLGTEIAQVLGSLITDNITIDEALQKCQDIANEVAKEGGYQK
jgi:sorbitol/mannitol transport system substrate-binding protein